MNDFVKTRNIVKIWLVTGLVMIFFQIVLGGITRLTGSGLSITKWDIVTGTLPPLNEENWNKEFDSYKETPQYHKINKGMSLSEFKFIFFWEYIHRLWARTMGFVFLIPLIYFLFKGYISKDLGKKLISVFVLAAIVASVGWIMVASGLINRPWVNAYKLSFHLILAVMLFSYLLWTCLTVYFPIHYSKSNNNLRSKRSILVAIIFMQIFIGGMMSGMKAGLLYPNWPTMDGDYVPDILLSTDNWNSHNFLYYEKNVFMPTLVQFLHRNLAYFIFFYGMYVSIKILLNRKNKLFTIGSYLLISLLIIQVLLGIFTLINCIGKIPLLLGVLHQGVAILVLGVGIFMLYINKYINLKNVNNPVS